VPDDPILRVFQEAFRDPIRTLRERILEKLDGVTGILLFGNITQGHADRRGDVDFVLLLPDHIN
jgi:predicted nucleotidyltransferase